LQVLEYTKQRSRVTSNAIDSLQAACRLVHGVGKGSPVLFTAIASQESDEESPDDDASKPGVLATPSG
jgi:hypothetical protein